MTRAPWPDVTVVRRLLPGAVTAISNARGAVADAVRGREERDLLAPGHGSRGVGQWLDDIAVDECWALLATDTVGRLAFTVNAGAPLVLPVNYAVHDRQIVIRSGRGPKLAAAARNDAVAFEVDMIDRVRRTGWSVVVTGRARVVHAADERARHSVVEPQPWVDGPRHELIVIKPAHVSGRRLLPPAPEPAG